MCPQIKVSCLVNRSSRCCHALLILIECLFLANHCQSLLKTIQPQAKKSYLLRQWLYDLENRDLAQCLSNLNRAYWNSILFNSIRLFSSSSLSHPCCFCDARNDVCFGLQLLKWVDIFELEADSRWAWGFVLMKGTWWGALILLPFSSCCLSALTGGFQLSLPKPNFFHWQAAHFSLVWSLYCLSSMQPMLALALQVIVFLYPFFWEKYKMHQLSMRPIFTCGV